MKEVKFDCVYILQFNNLQNRQAEGKESVAYKYYEIQDSSLKMYQECHADVLASIAKEYVPFVELSEEQLCK